MKSYIFRRLLLAIPTLIGVTITIFIAVRVIPGDPLAMIEVEGQGSVILTDEQLAAARASLGLDQPLYIQYLSWIGDVLRGDLGTSFWRGDPIIDVILRRGPITFEIAFLAIALAWIVGLPAGILGRQLNEALRLHVGLSKDEARAQAIELLRMVGIPHPEERVDQYPHEFSGGMRQRVMIAMALSCNPKLIIADEPTTALDVTIQAQILDLMRSLQAERNTGVIMITHSMGVVAGMADRVQVMYAGSIVETASTSEIFANPRHPYTVGLMHSIPRLDARERQRLEPIRGLPPHLVDLPDMCPFAPRCDYARKECRQKRPPLLEVAPGHKSACWFWEEVSADRVSSKEEA